MATKGKIIFESDDLKKLARYLTTNRNIVEKHAAIAMKKSMFTLERESKIESPVDTGRMRSSIRTSITPLISHLTVNTEYAIAVHDGANGRRANPFIDRAVDKSRTQVVKFFTDALDSITNDIKQNG